MCLIFEKLKEMKINIKINIDLTVLPSHNIAAHLSAQNSIVKCLNHTLIKYAYAIMLEHNISYFF